MVKENIAMESACWRRYNTCLRHRSPQTVVDGDLQTFLRRPMPNNGKYNGLLIELHQGHPLPQFQFVFLQVLGLKLCCMLKQFTILITIS